MSLAATPKTKPQRITRRAPTRPASRTQGGFSLIVALLMLIVITILGVGASQMSINEERGARSDRDKQIAFQAAEAALKDAEFEILHSPTDCGVAGEAGRGRPKEVGPFTCFNEVNSFGYSPHCSLPPNAGLCDYNSAKPAWVDNDPSTRVDFFKDASGGGDNRTVKYGQFTGKTYGSRETAAFAKQSLSRYAPRYIIELVPKNTSLDSLAASAHMFRITAMGFGANPNTQVVLQTVVSTKD